MHTPPFSALLSRWLSDHHRLDQITTRYPPHRQTNQPANKQTRTAFFANGIVKSSLEVAPTGLETFSRP